MRQITREVIDPRCVHIRRAGMRGGKSGIGGQSVRGYPVFDCALGRIDKFDAETERRIVKGENLCDGCPDFKEREAV